MKQKIFAGIATLLIIVAGVITPLFGFVTETFQVEHTYAQAPGSAQTFDGESPQTSTTVTTQSGASSTTTASGVITSVGDDKPTTEIVNEPPDDCGTYEFGCKFIVAVSQTITSVPFFLATLAGLVSDYSIWYSLQSSTYTAYDGKAGEEGIVVTGWKLVRDFSNLLFIFALFVIAFTLILNLDERAAGAPMGLDPKRTIARVIIMALLVNFSFFMGRAVIDLTNIVGLTFYNKITVAPKVIETGDDPYAVAAQQDVTSFYTNAVGIRSITSGILAQINPQRFILQNADIKYSDGAYGALFFIAIMSAVFGFFLVYLFLSIAILFISRTIGLFLAVIISPIAFVSYTIPALQKQSFIGFDDWLKQFFGLAFMAPVYLFFLYISLQFFKISLTAGSGLITMAAQVLVQFLVIGILLIYGKNLAKDLSGKMGTMVTNAVTSVATGAAVMAGAVATGGLSGAANLGRRYVGERLTEARDTVGKTAFGDDKYAAMNKQWTRAGGFSMLKGRGVMSSLKTMGRVAGAGSEPNFLSAAYSQGRVANRAYDIQNTKDALAKAKAAKEKKDAYEIGKETKKVDKEIAENKKNFDEGVIDKKEYTDTLKELAIKKREIVQKITDPAFAEKKADAEARSSVAAAEKQRNEEDIDAKLGVAEQKVIDTSAKLAQSNTELAAATTAAATATAARVAADTDAANKETAFKTAKSRGDTISKDIADIDKELSSLPKTGFNVDRVKLTTLEDKRKQLLADQVAANSETTTRNNEWSAAKLNQNSAAAAETTALNTKSALEATVATHEADHLAAETEHQEIGGVHATMDALMDKLEDDAKVAAEALKNKKTEVEIQEEIRKRTIVPKSDTDNRERTRERVETLQERLRNITSGGTTTP